jgi:hypothetical protein
MLRTASINQVQKKNANIYLVGDPQVTFFKSVFKRHTNFAIESFNIPPRNKPTLSKADNTIAVFEIPQYGDLLGKIYLKLTIPPMKTNTEKKFKFNDHLGYQIIENIKLKINGTVVDNIDGEMLYIMHKLRNRDEQQKILSTLINPVQGKDYLYNTTTSISGANSRTFSNKYFNSPIYTENQYMYIPLPFSFTHYSKTYLPLFLLENKSIEVEIELRNTDSIYTLEKKDKDYWYYDKIPDISASGYPIAVGPSGYTSRQMALDATSTSGLSATPAYGEQTTYKSTATTAYYLKRYESRTRHRPTINDTIDDYTYNGESFAIQPTLEVEEIFLTNKEKKQFTTRSNDYLIEQIYTKKQLNIAGNQTYSWFVDNHTNLVKEVYISITRSDNKDRNEFLNYTNYEEAGLTQEQIIKYQDNWWYDSIRASDSSESGEAETLTNSGGDITIIPDRFQEFLFRYGPYGESQNIHANGISGWPNGMEPQYTNYTIQEINKFRHTWKYRAASDIPQINKDNFSSTFKESPLKDMQILFDGIEREEVKDNIFYNVIQPYNYHTNSIDPGVYVYSFSLHPEDFQPSGFCNMNLFRRVQYKINLSDTENKASSTDKRHNYNITLYSLKYNFIKIEDKTIVSLFSLQI